MQNYISKSKMFAKILTIVYSLCIIFNIMDIKKVVADNVKNLREKLGISQAVFAEQIGKDQAYVSTLESGERNITLDTLQEIAKALKTKPHFLLNQHPRDNRLSYPLLSNLLEKEKISVVKEWYHQRFDGSPYLIHMIGEAECAGNNEIDPELNSTHKICIFDKKGADWFLDVSDNERITTHFLKEYPDKESVNKFIAHWDRREKAFAQKLEELWSL